MGEQTVSITSLVFHVHFSVVNLRLFRFIISFFDRILLGGFFWFFRIYVYDFVFFPIIYNLSARREYRRNKSRVSVLFSFFFSFENIGLRFHIQIRWHRRRSLRSRIRFRTMNKINLKLLTKRMGSAFDYIERFQAQAYETAPLAGLPIG